MSFLETVHQFESFDYDAYFQTVTIDDVRKSLDIAFPGPYDLLNLLSGTASGLLEEMAIRSQKLTRQHFGRTIGIYAPIYISDFCTNHCTYCGFNCHSGADRRKLTIEQIEAEAKAIADMGIRHILFLTGEAPEKTPMSYFEDTVRVLKKYFSSIGIEVFPMDEEPYRHLKNCGVDSVTVYQETYDRKIYKEVHPKGKKANFEYRLDTPERGARAGFRSVNIGPLFGLARPVTEAFLAGLHARYLEDHFPDVEISLSLPRMRKASGSISPRHELGDRQFVQFILAWRLFMPRLGISVSTRESAEFRDQILQLGVTRYSAGSKTDVGGYTLKSDTATPQFEITDDRSVDQVCQMIQESGYQPIFKDWELF